MNNHTDGSEKTQGVTNQDGTEHWMSPKQARYGARVAVLVLGLISVVVLGASFSMEKKGLKLRIGTDTLEGTLPEHYFGKARMLHGDNEDEDDDDKIAKAAPPKPAPAAPVKHWEKPAEKKGYMVKKAVVRSCGCVYYVYVKEGGRLLSQVSHFSKKHTSYQVIHSHHEYVNVSVSGYSKTLFQNINLFFGTDRKMLEVCKKL